MTSEQKKWLDQNTTYVPLGVTGGFAGHKDRGTLRRDGTFVKATKSAPISTDDGAFGVGVRVIRHPGETHQKV